VIVIAIAMLIPFVPVVLMTVPVDTIWAGIKNLLFKP
jgi:hypothetical protein